MDSNDDKVDPDYVTNNAALRNLEKRDENTVSAETIHRIISEEFTKELTLREKQLEEIEEQITKAQKLLHLVRYVIITSYYDKKSLEHTTTAEEQMSTVFDSQNRIHPAVKKLIGKNPTLDVFNIHGKRKAAKSSLFGEPSTSQVVETKKPKLEVKGISKTSVDSNQNCLQSRKKTRHRIVVGNISKYMSSVEDDNMTHKWMVYVRGDKSKPDISDIVEKVVFYLHPSYKPNDVVEVNESPFHLSRRGWGEFPLRVQIFFKSSLNKPVDIVHNLKLDKSCTGRQVLGNETLVDVYLRDSTPANTITIKKEPSDLGVSEESLDWQEIAESQSSSSTSNIELKEEPPHSEVGIFDLDLLLPGSSSLETTYIPLEDLDSTNEHSYCNNGLLDSSISQDHSYSLPSGSEDDSKIVKKEINITDILEQGNNRLIFGLGDNYLDDNKRKKVVIPKKSTPASTTSTPLAQSIKILPATYSKLVNLNNGHSVQVWVLPQGIPNQQKPTHSKQVELRTVQQDTPMIDYEKYKVTLPKNRFKNLGEALMYLMRRLPLWDERRKDLNFRCTFPYVAGNRQEFERWNVGKRANSEFYFVFQWCRARMLKSILSEEKFPSVEKWSTKTYFMYARSHGYCALVKHRSLFSKYSKDITLISECFSTSLSLPKNISRRLLDADLDYDVDVESNGDARSNSLEPTLTIDLDQSDTILKNQCVFVKEAALDVGVVLKPEQIVEGVTMNAAERVMLEAVKCFAENLIRRAHHHLVCQTTHKDGCLEVTKDEIQVALKDRSEMESIFTFKRMKKERQLFS
ncbi:unnamed protein product [Acanthoscelides obtectus]|uniref:YEATS domain-containing protein n=2 Tax=Acanthoscelides obtectus TaxID=200917 RepID=A0A9P0PXM1_ACAOB|nr:unnamed protein product [Acanthoscelides obtectus]CAK1643101.1 YEATS domain-containing protein 2 [Acanthoscelides obtectus]